MLHPNLSVIDGHLCFAGQDTVSLAKKYGTPLYLFDEDYFLSAASAYREAMSACFPAGSNIAMASKALSFVGVYRLAKEAGIWADTVSSGELFTALKAGFDPQKIFFHSNNKTDADIAFGIEHDVGYFVADCLEELDALEVEAARQKKQQKILLRITPGIDPHTHQKIVTGNVDSKFGFAIATGQAVDAVRYALAKPHLTLCGFHCHIGSQIFDAEPFITASHVMAEFIRTVRDSAGYTASILNLGGGFGVRYIESQPKLDIGAVLREISEELNRACLKNGIEKPMVFFEPGRSLVAAAGMTLYTVGSKKVIPGYKTYVSIDGGMPDNPRYALYQADYTCLIANRADAPQNERVTVAGRCCESGDLIQENAPLQDCQRGDTLAVLVTGAYNYSMASNYNKIPRPPIISLRGGKDFVSVRRESFEDLARNEL